MLALIAGAALGLTHAEMKGTLTLADGRPARNAVVWFQGKEKGTPLKDALIDQRNRAFSPHILVVTIGTKVAFPNNDVIFHNVFSEYHAERFDFGMYARGKSKSQVFDRGGVAVLLCSIHPDMSAYVVVVDTPYYAIADKNGKYRLPSLPSGQYTVRAWQESGSRAESTVTVGAQGSLDLSLRRGD